MKQFYLDKFIVLEESLEELNELFSDDFMKKYTNFNSFEEFKFSGAVFINWNAKEIMGAREAFDHCVFGTSKYFLTWEEMYQKAKKIQKESFE